MGQEYVRILTNFGFKVIAGCLFPDGQGAKSLVEGSENPERIKVIGIDVTSDVCVKNAMEEVNLILEKDDLQLFAIINNAGVSPTSVFEWSDINEDFVKTFDVNVFGTMRVCQSFLPLLRKCEEGGRIVNIASIAGREGVPQQGPCCSSKAGIIAFSTTLRRELRQFGIKVITIEPYFFATGLNSFNVMRSKLLQRWETNSEEIKKIYGQEYLDSWLLYYERILCERYCKDLNIAASIVLKSLTNQFPEYVYVSVPLIQGMIIWFYLTLIPLHIHERLYKLLDQVVKYSYQFCHRYQVTEKND